MLYSISFLGKISMEKDLTIGWLLDFYAGFLTLRQRTILDLYYNNDYSLSEIAQQEGISRQGVLDTIQRGAAHLKKMESELKLLAKYQGVNEALDHIAEIAEKLYETDKRMIVEQLVREVKKAKNIWEET